MGIRSDNIWKLSMDAENLLFKHYKYITKIVKIKTARYGLDYDDGFNFALNNLTGNDYKIIKAFKGESQFRTYITVVVNRLIISYARKQKRLPESATFNPETPLDVLLERQQTETKELFQEHLPELLQKLDSKSRMVVKMKYFKNFSVSRISEALEMTRYDINKMLESSLDFFQKQIEELSKK